MALPPQDDVLLAALKLWGEPTSRSKKEFLYGEHGARKVDLQRLIWVDHSGKTVSKRTGKPGGGAIELLELAGIEWENGGEHRSGEKSSTVKEHSRPEPVAYYGYRDEKGDLLFEVVRYPKGTVPRFRQRRPDGQGWIWKLGETRRVLYKLPELLAASPVEPVWVPEGEKDVDTLRRWGLVATCNPGGAEKWQAGFSICLKGRDVILLPDNDAPGRRHVAQVARAIEGLARRTRFLALPGLPEKGDVTDWAEAGGTLEALLALASGLPEAPPAAAEAPWLDRCLLSEGRNPTPLPVLANALMALRAERPDTYGFDEMLSAPTVRASKPKVLKDDDITGVQEWMQLAGLKRIGWHTVGQALDHHARKHSYHPVRSYLEGLAWDMRPRLAYWLSTYLGVPRSPYADAIGPMFLRSMVARIFDPGCKVDYMLVLEGPQGALKSTACKVLAGGSAYYSDNLPDISRNPKDASQHLRGLWVVEISEMHAFSKAESTDLKGFITRVEQRYRPAYGRLDVIEPRQCVFIGTSNKEAYLRDETGGRRFWPVRCVNAIDIAALKRDRDQLLAEAVVEYRNGVPWWPEREFEIEHIAPQQEERFEFDEWTQAISDYLKQRVKDHEASFDRAKPLKVHVRDITQNALHLDLKHVTRTEEMRVAAVLKKLEWVRHRSAVERWYEPPAPAPVGAATPPPQDASQ